MKASIVILIGNTVTRRCLQSEKVRPQDQGAVIVGNRVHVAYRTFAVSSRGEIIPNSLGGITNTAKVISEQDAAVVDQMDQEIEELTRRRDDYLRSAAQRGRLLRREDCRQGH